MARCPVCKSNSLNAIEEDLRNRTMSYGELSEKHGVFRAALSFHLRHCMGTASATPVQPISPVIRKLKKVEKALNRMLKRIDDPQKQLRILAELKSVALTISDFEVHGKLQPDTAAPVLTHEDEHKLIAKLLN